MRGIIEISGANWPQEVVVRTTKVREFLPDLEIAPPGEHLEVPTGGWYCFCRDEYRQEPCEVCNLAVEIAPDGKARFIARPPSHLLSQFDWEWSGSGFVEHWFDDEARSLRGGERDYVSRSGLTGEVSRIVAYKRHVEVRSYRRYGGDRLPAGDDLQYGVIWEEWRNYSSQPITLEGGLFLTRVGNTPVISDDKESLIEALLAESWPRDEWPVTTCRHNSSVRAIIRLRPENAGYLGRFLCWSCRMQGLRWEEISHRNTANRCPYIARALKAFGRRSDPLPEWVGFKSPILLSRCRLVEGEKQAWELLFLRQSDGFVRRCVLLLDTAIKEARMYYPVGLRSLADLKEKYGEGRIISTPEPEDTTSG